MNSRMSKHVKRARLTVDSFGGAPSLGVQGVIERYIEDRRDKGFLSFAEDIKKKSETVTDILPKILSVHHRDDNGYPAYGDWMFRANLLETGKKIFNKKEDKEHPSQASMTLMTPFITPIYINFYRGKGKKIITEPDGVKTFTVTTKKDGKERSFFKAYEYIKAGAEFEVTIHFYTQIIKEEHIEALLEFSGIVGLGAYRSRFGKFEWIK